MRGPSLPVDHRTVAYVVCATIFFFFYLYKLSVDPSVSSSSSPAGTGAVSSLTILSPERSALRGAITTDQANERHRRRIPATPPSRGDIGRSTWLLLHSVATNFDDHPSPAQQEAALQLIQSLISVYPCQDCALDFRNLVLAELPPVVTSRKEFSRWTCQAHNLVNAKLSYPLFDCSRMDETYLGIGDD